MLARECSQSNFEFVGRWSRSVVPRFDGSRISSHGGGLRWTPKIGHGAQDDSASRK